MSNYGYQGPPPGPQYQTDAPNATTALVLGIIGIFCFGIILGPIAIVLGTNALKAIEQSGGAYGGEGKARAGQILGIIATVLSVLGIIILLAS
jgi:hypothetical protein